MEKGRGGYVEGLRDTYLIYETQGTHHGQSCTPTSTVTRVRVYMLALTTRAPLVTSANNGEATGTGKHLRSRQPGSQALLTTCTQWMGMSSTVAGEWCCWMSSWCRSRATTSPSSSEQDAGGMLRAQGRCRRAGKDLLSQPEAVSITVFKI